MSSIFPNPLTDSISPPDRVPANPYPKPPRCSTPLVSLTSVGMTFPPVEWTIAVIPHIGRQTILCSDDIVTRKKPPVSPSVQNTIKRVFQPFSAATIASDATASSQRRRHSQYAPRCTHRRSGRVRAAHHRGAYHTVFTIVHVQRAIIDESFIPIANEFAALPSVNRRFKSPVNVANMNKFQRKNHPIHPVAL